MTHRPTLLIADDDCELVQVLAIRSRSLGVDVIAAYDALQALNVMRTQRPDLVCLDVNMPRGNGLSVCEMLASEPDWAKIPIILLTGRSDPDVIMRCHQLCAYYVLKGGDIWSRVEPLVRELLSLGDPAGSQALPVEPMEQVSHSPVVARSASFH